MLSPPYGRSLAASAASVEVYCAMQTTGQCHQGAPQGLIRGNQLQAHVGDLSQSLPPSQEAQPCVMQCSGGEVVLPNQEGGQEADWYCHYALQALSGIQVKVTSDCKDVTGLLEAGIHAGKAPESHRVGPGNGAVSRCSLVALAMSSHPHGWSWSNAPTVLLRDTVNPERIAQWESNLKEASYNMIKQLIDISTEEYDKAKQEADDLSKKIEDAYWGHI
ncbi:hypothetical protein NDU88_001633 [Pleurodeles waltl]|uniref:Uncharacterized protein n=1 Tax=Pleurodeles waltl TaxID=8319 RepID=A0AAV7VX22_PLEWA|nr:hypothetical protein NDU88_001633 [Pleurodeles waltl]